MKTYRKKKSNSEYHLLREELDHTALLISVLELIDSHPHQKSLHLQRTEVINTHNLSEFEE